MADEPRFSPELLRRLEVFREPDHAWARFGQKTRREIVRALAKTVWIHPDSDGYILVVEWEGGARAAAKVATVRRKKLYPIPDEVSALFGEELAHENVSRRVASHSSTGRRAAAHRLAAITPELDCAVIAFKVARY